MEIRVQSLKFNADQKLLDHVEKKVAKLGKFDEEISSVEVSLSLTERPDNKCAKLLAHVPGGNLVTERQAATFEEAVNEAVNAMLERIKRNKEKRTDA